VPQVSRNPMTLKRAWRGLAQSSRWHPQSQPAAWTTLSNAIAASRPLGLAAHNESTSISSRGLPSTLVERRHCGEPEFAGRGVPGRGLCRRPCEMVLAPPLDRRPRWSVRHGLERRFEMRHDGGRLAVLQDEPGSIAIVNQVALESAALKLVHKSPPFARPARCLSISSEIPRCQRCEGVVQGEGAVWPLA